MNYIENVYICLAAPLLLILLCFRGGRRRQILFLIGGMTVCLLSSYISTFLALVCEADRTIAAMEIAPFVEEVMKLLPAVFYLLVFEAPQDRIADCVLMTAAGFATFENICFLITNGASDLLDLVIRGFGTGAMHIVCGMVSAIGLMILFERPYLRFVGTVALLGSAAVYHGIFNVLVSQQGLALVLGAVIPAVTAVGILLITKNWRAEIAKKNSRSGKI